MRRDQEFELKLRVVNGDLRSVASHPILRSALAGKTVSRLDATYWDTERCDLARHRISFRVRRDNGRIVHTLKRATRSRIKRDEWESATARTEPDLAWARGTPAGKVLKAIEDRALAPQFTVAVTRTVLQVERNGATFEIALDQGEIRVGNRHQQVCEVEIERRSGEVAQVFALARALARTLPLELSLSSKAERGFALAGGALDRPSKALDLDLAAAGTIAEVFGAIAQACLHGLTRNAALIDPERPDPEPVHHARILLRHLRAAVALFKPTLRRRTRRALRADLKWMSDRLGAARDADVFLKTHAPKAFPEAAHAAEAERVRAYRDLTSALGSSRWRLLLIDLAAFSIRGVRRSSRTKRFGPFVADRLLSAHARVSKEARGLKQKTADERHALRKSAKMLRYAVDFFLGVTPPALSSHAARHLSRHLHTLQTALGELHDQEEAERKLATLTPGNYGPQSIRSNTPATASSELQQAVKAARKVKRLDLRAR